MGKNQAASVGVFVSLPGDGGPAPRRASSPDSSLPVGNHRTSPRSGRQNPASASRLAPRGTFVRDESESAPGRGRPRPAAEGAPRREDPVRLQLRALGRRGYGGGRARALVPARPAALAPRRLPERARRLRSEAPAAMIAGSGARARARARLGGPRADRRSPACAQKRARRGQRLEAPARRCRGQRVPRSSGRGPGTGLGVDGGGGLPSGQGARQGDPAAASRTALVRRREGRGARNNFLLPWPRA
ncbi:translation initiation factor IF-2-like [Mirounga leonina]|uniref:translation initiation factor IF-2-like n=1 Tax=Mirounga leonina TaxID=9715 RepID=UPI00156BEB9D|nr:translation initiation factor IF-2-like [Mirounga leonina]